MIRECEDNIKRKQNVTLKEKLRALGNAFYNGSEISAQEAAWCRLKLPMTKSTRVVTYINTSPIPERSRILKPTKILNSILAQNPNSTNIYNEGDIERYSQRPQELSEVCLARFVSDYTYEPYKRRTRGETNNDEDSGSENDEPQVIENSGIRKFHLLNGNGFVKPRTKSKVIRYRKYSIHQDRPNYFRVLIMLFHPWRNEETQVENSDCEQIFNTHKDAINNNYKLFHANNSIDSDNDVELENAILVAENDEIELNENRDTHSELNPYTYDENIIQPDIIRDIVGEEVPLDISRKFPIPKLFNDEQLNILYSTLNDKQHEICLDILNRFKRNDNLPFYYFISGGAGVGKSRLITAIYQSTTKFFGTYQDTSMDLPFVLLVAPTGKAAHNIDGITAHQAFSLVVNQSEAKCGRLSDDVSNTLYTKLCKIKLIIIDEISMLSSNQFFNIDRRLKQIFKSTIDFANIPILVFGDFNQLNPMGKLIFQPPKMPNATNDLVQVLDSNPLWEKFQMIELTEIMRQRDDAEFARALSRYANGKFQAFS